MKRFFNFGRVKPSFSKAFTLAETLIVIGIIGVVAALTLPNLNHATGDKEKVTKVKKIYSALTDAVDRAQVIYGDLDTWFKDLSTQEEKSERFAKRVTEFMKISKDCGFSEGCWSSAPFTYLDGTTEDSSHLSHMKLHYYMVNLSDGVSLGFTLGSSRPQIKVDIDGPSKGKTQQGSDIFDFTIYIHNESNLPVNQLFPSRGIQNSPSSWNDTSDNATLWVVENGNLDYLKCIDELDWDTQTSCK